MALRWQNINTSRLLLFRGKKLLLLLRRLLVNPLSQKKRKKRKWAIKEVCVCALNSAQLILDGSSLSVTREPLQNARLSLSLATGVAFVGGYISNGKKKEKKKENVKCLRLLLPLLRPHPDAADVVVVAGGGGGDGGDERLPLDRPSMQPRRASL